MTTLSFFNDRQSLGWSVALLLILGGVLVVAFFSLAEAQIICRQTAQGSCPKEEIVNNLEEKMRRVGVQRTYDEFYEEVMTLPLIQQHQNGHFFGAALSRIEGVNAFALCGVNFSYGCIHEFLGNKVLEQGMEGIVAMAQECGPLFREGPNTCQHGIGHGLMAYMGQERTHLLQALALCETLDDDLYAIKGCYGGVFMEYLDRSLEGEGKVRPYEGDSDPLRCRSLSPQQQVSCIYWTTEWWLIARYNGSPQYAEYAEMGKECRTFADSPRIYRGCFEGVGDFAARQADRDYRRPLTMCSVAAQTVYENVLCRAGAASIFAVQEVPESAVRMCDGLEGNSHSFCLQYAHNKNHVFNPAPLSF